MKVIVTGDWHLESGQHLGDADPEVGNTRLRDAERVLTAICQEPCDVLVFLGDLARTATPGPTAYAIARRALESAVADHIVMLVGNHDFTGEKATCVDVVGGGTRAIVCSEPRLIDVPTDKVENLELLGSATSGIQIGVVPWTPPSRLFAAAPHDPRAMNTLAGDALTQVALGLSAGLDGRPSLLVGHWLLAGGALQQGADVIQAREPLLSATALEAQGWDAIAFGHNHRHQLVGENSWHVGPPMRGGFGEESIETGYMLFEWEEEWEARPPSPKATFVPVHDRPIWTLDVDPELPDAWSPAAPADPAGSIVRVRLSCTEEELAWLQADNALEHVVAQLREAGAVKVVGPQITVDRAERARRSDMTVDTDPFAALGVYLDQNDPANRDLVEREARRIMS